ncbi:MAG: type-F conjugative transfer system protein TraW [Piscinibacter sp.]|uniref:type-F conjugative transfer system protein TraW n=1 Tax=Piscinibacter sp. TaxID=1903157 RepID=UPI003D14943B
MRARLSPWLFAAATCWALGAQAANLGTIGPTYPVAEKNMLDVIMARLRAKEASGELKRHEQEARDRAAYAINNPRPVDGLRRAQAARTFYFDPTFTLQSNVVDGTGAVLFPAGTRKNPLEVVSLSKHLLFFDARDPGQVARARELIEHYQGKVKPILVGGSYLDLMKRWNKPVFYDQDGTLVRKFGIAAVPAIVSQEGQRLRIDEVPVR